MARGMLCLLALCLACGAAASGADPARRTPVVEAVEKARLSVVNISAEKLVTLEYRDPFFGGSDDVFNGFLRQFFSEETGPPRKVESPLGSGILIDASGYVLTNEHVVRRASGVKLSMADGTTHDAVLIAADPARDVALLRVENPQNFRPITMGASGDLMLGETVIALGNPFGFENSVTTGIVSALHRSIAVGRGATYEGLIQTSALINPGNSGGPLLNINGDLIGMNTAVVSGAQGIGFAIPVDAIKDVLADLFCSPRVTNLWLGASLERDPQRPGARVSRLEAGSPAAAQLRVGDVIVSADGQAINEPYDLAHSILALKAGHELALRLLRDGGQADAQVVIIERPRPTPARLIAERLGISCADVTPSLASRRRLNVSQGALIDEVTKDGPAERAGLEAGDVIVQVGRSRVRNADELSAILQGANAGESLYIQIVRGRYVAYAQVEVR